MPLGRMIGQLMFHLGPRRRAIADTNLRRCFPKLNDDDHQALLKESFSHLGAMFIDLGVSWFAPSKKLRKMAEIKGMEHLESALSLKKGVILLLAHQTALELGGQILAQALQEQGHPLVVMYKRSRGALMETLVQRGRYRFTQNIIHHNDMRSVLRGLREGYPTWYAPDQDFGPRRSIFTTFFGVDAASIPMTHKIAKTTEAPLITCDIHRNSETGQIHIELSPVVEGFPSGDLQADTQRINDLQEAIIQRHPAQYYWVHRRFKTQPPGSPVFYK